MPSFPQIEDGSRTAGEVVDVRGFIDGFIARDAVVGAGAAFNNDSNPVFLYGQKGFTLLIESDQDITVKLWAAELDGNGDPILYKLRDSSGAQYTIDFDVDVAGTKDTYARTFTELVPYLVIRGQNDTASEATISIRVV